MTKNQYWHEVNKKNPCQICGHNSWCTISNDDKWAICRRIDTGEGISRIDKSGGEFWLYRVGAISDTRNEKYIPPYTHGAMTEPKVADVPVLNMVYHAVLDNLPLLDIHREQLYNRGLCDTEINLRGYRSINNELAMSMIDQLIKDVDMSLNLYNVPGFIQTRLYAHVFISTPGILIPIRGYYKNIVSLIIRRDNPEDGPKYVYVSSKKYNGPSPGSRIHIPLFNGNCNTVRITEGALKADIATALSGTLTLGIPGVSVWRGLSPLLQTLNVKKVIFAIDADAGYNVNVSRALMQMAQNIMSDSLILCMEMWDINDGKGIDDILVKHISPAIVYDNDVIRACADIHTRAVRRLNKLGV